MRAEENMRYTIAEYEQRDAMPREAAIELLTNGGKLTARIRKACRAALERAIPSAYQIRHTWSDDGGKTLQPFNGRPACKFAIISEDAGLHARGGFRAYDTEITPKLFECRVAERMRRVPFVRLIRMLRRIDRRSRSVHAAMMRASSLRTEGLRDELLARLQTQLDKFAKVRQIVVDEILIGRKQKHE